METCIDIDLWMDTLNYLIISGKQNLCWLMEHVNIDRTDEWRDRKFNEIRSQIDAWVAEREECIKQMGKQDA